MNPIFKFTIEARKTFIRLIEDLSIDQLNEIPAGFNNNIIWNFGHIVVTTPLLAYIRTGISQDGSAVKYAAAYSKGTKPSYVVSQEEVDELKALAISSIESLEQDYLAGKFTRIQAFETSTYNNHLQTIEDVLLTCVGHDNLHYGCAMAQKRIINSN